MEKQILFTIGHSNLDLETFIDLLKVNGIEVLVDIRSQPYSRFASQFNKAHIQRVVQANGMKYLFLGKELGGKPKDPEFYDSEGNVLYTRIAQSELFAEGIARLTIGVKTYRVAIMCSEENPVNCHRRFLIGRVMADHEITIQHIRKDGRIQSEAEVI